MEDVDFEPDDEMEAEAPAAEEKKEAEASAVSKVKGRGGAGSRATGAGGGAGADRYSGRGGVFESVSGADGSGPCRSVEGWIIVVTGIHEEAQEDQILDAFAEFGEVKNINVNLDRRTGYVKGYALVEFEKKSEAEAAINEMHGNDFLGQKLAVDWAFLKSKGAGRRKGARGGAGRR